MFEFWLKFHWSLFLGVQLTISQHWFRWWLGADQATSHYLNQWWLDYRRKYASLGLNELKGCHSHVILRWTSWLQRACSQTRDQKGWPPYIISSITVGVPHDPLQILWNIVSSANAYMYAEPLTHWGRVTHICVGNLTITGPDNVLSPGRRQAIIWTNAGILLIGPWGTHFSEISIGIQTFSFKKMHLKMSSAKWPPFCLGHNVLRAKICVWNMSYFVVNMVPTVGLTDLWLFPTYVWNRQF